MDMSSTLTTSSLVWNMRTNHTKSTETSVTAASPHFESDYSVLVTGGAGFLGQHVVKLLQESAPNIKDIVVYDTKQYVNRLGEIFQENPDCLGSYLPGMGHIESTTSGHPEPKRITSIVGDIRDASRLKEALYGVSGVIHTAGAISFNMFPDIDKMETVNVQGTNVLLEACKEMNVRSLVFSSTIDVVIGKDSIICGDEETTSVPRKFMFKGYPDTKRKAEVLVRQAHGTKLENGEDFATLSLRPNIMYGEEDPYYIPNALISAKSNGGNLRRIGDGYSKFQHAYVGNVAWAHITALDTLMTRKDVGGKEYFITDDSPVSNCFDLMKPFLRAKGYDLSSKSTSYRLAYGVLYCLEWMVWFLKPIFRINPQVSLSSLVYLNTTIYFSSLKARRELNYHPIISFEDALAKSVKFYGTLKI